MPVFCHTHSDFFFLLIFKWNFLNSGLCPSPLVLSLATAEKNLAFSPLPHPNRHLYMSVRCFLSFLLPRLNSLSLSSYESYFSRLTFWLFAVHAPVCLCVAEGSPELDPAGLSSGEGSPPSTPDALPNASLDAGFCWLALPRGHVAGSC